MPPISKPNPPARRPILVALAPNLGVTVSAYADLARQAEAAGFQALILPMFEAAEAAAPVEETLDPVMVAAAVGAVTSRIGLIATADPSYDQPYNFARRFASTDLLSEGRAGWAIRLGESGAQALNFSLEAPPPRAERISRAREFAQVVKGLWDSWGPGALVRDVAAGRYFDPAKLHVLDHKGAHFTVRGPLNTPRAPQGRPVIAYLDPAEDELDLAAEAADLVCARPPDLAAAQVLAQALKARVGAAAPSLLCDLELALGGPVQTVDPPQATEHIAAWLAAGGADGFVLRGGPEAMAAFADRLAPALIAGGLLEASAPAGLLRERLGLVADAAPLAEAAV